MDRIGFYVLGLLTWPALAGLMHGLDLFRFWRYAGIGHGHGIGVNPLVWPLLIAAAAGITVLVARRNRNAA